MNDQTIKLLSDKEWRLNHLYKIYNKQGDLIRFKLNKAQQQYFNDRSETNRESIARDIILKARQLGMTTFCLVDFFDDVLFSKGINARFIAQGEREMKESFRKIKVLWETLEIKPFMLGMGLKVTEETTTSLAFSTGSSISVTLSGRGGTFQRLHISELAKIQTLSDLKAEEIRTGSLNTVPNGGRIVIESTAEGMGGMFYEYWQKAKDSQTFYKPHFFPWFYDESYRIKTIDYNFSNDELELRSKIKLKYNYDLQDDQLYWYKLKREEQGAKIVQEFATFDTEAFIASGRLFFNTANLQNIQPKTGQQDTKYQNLIWYKRNTDSLLLGVDVAEGLDTGDYSVIRGYDREGRLICHYRDHIEPDNLPRAIDYILKEIKTKAIIGIEANNHGNTVITHAKAYDWYFDIYVNKDIDKISNKPKNKRGWTTNAITRPIMLDELEEAVRQGLIELDQPILSEIFNFVNINSKPQANSGSHDDCFVKGTMILTDKGNIPIENIKIGDMVLTRKGYRPVVKTRNKIKSVITNIGLTGTPDHPIITTKGKKNLSLVSDSDTLYIYNKEKKCIEKQSYTKAKDIIDIQNQQEDNIMLTTGDIVKMINAQWLYIDKYGLIISGKFLKGISYIIKIATHSIIKLKILKYLQPQNMQKNTCERRVDLNFHEKMERSNQIGSQDNLKSGEIIIQKKQSRYIEIMAKNKLVHFVKNLLNGRRINQRKPEKQVKNQLIEILCIKKKLQKYVTIVTKNLQQYQKEKNFVPKSAVRKEIGKIIIKEQRVYNLQIGEVHEYFANNILVHNCIMSTAICWQMRKQRENREIKW